MGPILCADCDKPYPCPCSEPRPLVVVTDCVSDNWPEIKAWMADEVCARVMERGEPPVDDDSAEE